MNFTRRTRISIGMTVLAFVFGAIAFNMIQPNAELQAREHQRATDEQSLQIMTKLGDDMHRLATVSLGADPNARFSAVSPTALMQVHANCASIANLRQQVAARVSAPYSEMLEESLDACSSLGKTAQHRQVIYNDLLNLSFSLHQSRTPAERDDAVHFQNTEAKQQLRNTEKYAESNIKAMASWTTAR